MDDLLVCPVLPFEMVALQPEAIHAPSFLRLSYVLQDNNAIGEVFNTFPAIFQRIARGKGHEVRGRQPMQCHVTACMQTC